MCLCFLFFFFLLLVKCICIVFRFCPYIFYVYTLFSYIVLYLFRRMNKIGLKNVDCGSACASLHQTAADYLLFTLASRQSPNCWLCYEKLKLFAFHIILSPTPLHHLPIIWKAFITKSFSFLKSHSCPTYITFKWIQNLCWSPRIWTTESRYSTFISFHQIPQLQILNSIQTLNFTCKYKVFKQLHSTQQCCKTWSMWKPGKLWKL